ncbi:sodium/potassium-transporting ATPase subunit beta-1-interacting protein 1-like [Oscarella lobularis]|uniref:sodium/potassium-transporting ATPase subunit beta-1-interacting protein 1-like n=1 Tax=Oscarella lobularis TaxID=121494 RepID=UPI0033144704
MSVCSSRCIILFILSLQLITTLERGTFDGLGQLWSPLIADALNIIFVIVGMIGTRRFKAKAVVVYAVWCVLWIAINTIIILIYLEVNVFVTNKDNKADNKYLNFGLGGVSWWRDHGIGCSSNTTSTSTTSSGTTLIPTTTTTTTGCLIDYKFVEIIHAGVQIVLAVLGFGLAVYVAIAFGDEDDHFDFVGADAFVNTGFEMSGKTGHLQLQPVTA